MGPTPPSLEQVVVMEAGKVVEAGRPADLVSDGGRFAHLAQASSK
jgi:ABC-type multidrug transport system fused ATPase/permease subunit